MKVLVTSMAITKIHPIKSTLNLAIDYITKSEKTEEIIFSIFIKILDPTHIQFKNTRKKNTLYKSILDRQ